MDELQTTIESLQSMKGLSELESTVEQLQADLDQARSDLETVTSDLEDASGKIDAVCNEFAYSEGALGDIYLAAC